MNKQFSREVFQNLLLSELKNLLQLLEKDLVKKFNGQKNFRATVENIIKELKELGHPLYQLDYYYDQDELFEVWGGVDPKFRTTILHGNCRGLMSEEQTAGETY